LIWTKKGMKVGTLLIVITAFVIGAGAKFAYDAYQEYEQQKILEQTFSGDGCSLCDTVKEDLKLKVEENKKKNLLEEQAQ